MESLAPSTSSDDIWNRRRRRRPLPCSQSLAKTANAAEIDAEPYHGQTSDRTARACGRGGWAHQATMGAERPKAAFLWGSTPVSLGKGQRNGVESPSYEPGKNPQPRAGMEPRPYRRLGKGQRNWVDSHHRSRGAEDEAARRVQHRLSVAVHSSSSSSSPSNFKMSPTSHSR